MAKWPRLPQTKRPPKKVAIGLNSSPEIQYGRFPTGEALFHTIHSAIFVSVLIATKAPQETPDSTPDETVSLR
jgi:hypothetical protein